MSLKTAQKKGSVIIHDNKMPLLMKTQVLGDKMVPTKKKGKALHTKNPYVIKKPDPFRDVAKPEKILDGFYILEKSGCELPHEVISIKLPNKNIVDISENDLRYFVNLSKVDLSENHIKHIRKLAGLQALCKLEIQNNGIEEVDFLERDAIEPLEEIDMAFNLVQFTTIKNLNVHPNLRILNLCGNELSDLPDDLSGFQNLEILNLSCNKFESNQKAARFWASLASIPKLRDLDVSRNLLRGIHTERLIPGNFNKLERLDFGYNRAENQHNLICTRNFKGMKILIITGNPFGFFNQHKGLEKEIYMRVGAILINENVELPYIKAVKKKGKASIKFDNIYTLQPDNLKPRSKTTFFGVELPPEEEINAQRDEMEPPQEEPEEEDFDQAKFFVTEAQHKNARKNRPDNGFEDMNPDINEQEPSQEDEKDEYEDEVPNQYKIEGDFQEQISNNLDLVNTTEDLKRVASQMIGDGVDYDKAVDINTAYKLLRQMVKKPGGSTQTVDSFLNRVTTNKKDQTVTHLSKKGGKAGSSRMADVEMLIDKLNNKMTSY